MPWRLTRDPYAIWVSEIMLQQTQVATVIGYFERWMERFPTVASLAAADDQDVLSLWQGLGYYRRCRNLLAGARWVVKHGMPVSAAGWQKVPGVGRYTAGAIASIAQGEAVPVVDGNVERVFARLTGCDSSGPALNKSAWAWAPGLVSRERPGDWNQALMELGATVCKPREPLCASCPLSSSCCAFAVGRQSELPVMLKQPKTVALGRLACVVVCQDRFGLEQIPAGEWWEGMWRFPAIDRGEPIGVVKHAVTHHRITMRVYLDRLSAETTDFAWYSQDELKHLPMPAAQRRALAIALASLS